jgi:hypothetical protein
LRFVTFFVALCVAFFVADKTKYFVQRYEIFFIYKKNIAFFARFSCEKCRNLAKKENFLHPQGSPILEKVLLLRP